MHAVEQTRAERPGRMRTGKIFFIKATRLHNGDGQRVAHHQRVDGAGGGGQVHRAGFAFNGDIQHRVGCQRQRRIRFAGHRQQHDRFLLQTRDEVIQLFGAAGIGDK